MSLGQPVEGEVFDPNSRMKQIRLMAGEEESIALEGRNGLAGLN